MVEQKRIIIENIVPQVDGGAFPIKRVPKERVDVYANVFADGHDEIVAWLLYRIKGTKKWRSQEMQPLGNDRLHGFFLIDQQKDHEYAICGYVFDFGTWRRDLNKKIECGQDVKLEVQAGAEMILETANGLEYPSSAKKLRQISKKLQSSKKNEDIREVAFRKELLDLMKENISDKKKTMSHILSVHVDPKLAGFSSWYEIFPRSCSKIKGQHGTFKDCAKIFPEIARMGFDIVYLPPIHPIGVTKRKGKNNAVHSGMNDPGSPWAIGSKQGGHKSIHPELGTMKDFHYLLKTAKDNNLEVAMDIAFQCSPDHPYVNEHPLWFKRRPDGTIQFAENPPKKYEDIFPILFENKDWKGLWQELKSIVLFWAKQGVRVFRVDNPHTKPFVFWDWLIKEVRQKHPDVIFLSEAFTRPHLMYRLAKGGFTQSYTYFTWRDTKKEFIDYLKEIAQTEIAEFFRPNFWPNTPDILPGHLQNANRAAFIQRLILAATMSSNYGIYGPAFELCVNEPYPAKEEYLNSEKYEIKHWNRDQPGNIKDIISCVNKIRRKHAALQMTRNICFCEVNNEKLISFYKSTDDHSDIILVVVSLDLTHRQAGIVELPIEKFGIEENQEFQVKELFSQAQYTWRGRKNYVDIKDQEVPGQIFHIQKKL